VENEDRLYPAFAGRDPDEALLAWMREFSLKTDRPFFYERSGERFGFGPREFQMEMLAKLDSGERCGRRPVGKAHCLIA